MTLFNPRVDTPAAIQTLEQNIGHNLLLAHHLHQNDTYNELGGGSQERIVQTSIITSANRDIRLIGRVSLILDPSYVTASSQKLWTFISAWADGTVPADFKID